MFAAIGRFAYRWRRMVIAAWVVLFAAGLMIGGQTFSRVKADLEGSGDAESVIAHQRLEELGSRTPDILGVVDGVQIDAPATEQAISATSQSIAEIEGVEVESEVYEPGETLKATVFVRPYNGTRQRVRVSLPLPADLPEGSYREMTEWALPTDQQVVYKRITEQLKQQPEWDEAKPFVRAGFWRNFLVKYPESNELYCRSREVSSRFQSVENSDVARQRPDLLHLAKMELYRGQCNCPFWHGAFGGLYLPHLRNAIYRHLIAADTACEQLAGRSGRWVDAAHRVVRCVPIPPGDADRGFKHLGWTSRRFPPPWT